MEIRSLFSGFIRNLISIPGWRTKKHLVVFESDDWGSIRMPSSEIYSRFISNGFDIAGSDYNRLDTLESNDDLSRLFEVLAGHKDITGSHPAITANIVVGNPDFKKIQQSGFTEYYYEPVTDTLKRYSGRDRVESLWKEGYSSGLFVPQFHGREHVNAVRWMKALRKKSPAMMFTFTNETTFSGDGDYNFMEVLDYDTPSDIPFMKDSLSEGLNLFEEIFGYRSRSFIAPCYTWNSAVEKTLYDNGVKYLQGLLIQSVPTGSFGNYKSKYHWLGSQNRYGQYYLVRNCFFEPSLSKTPDTVNECLNRMKIAYRWNKPAVISTHRINFMGSLDVKNRERNLILFHELLTRILKEWPDAEFITTEKLGDMIARDKEGSCN